VQRRTELAGAVLSHTNEIVAVRRKLGADAHVSPPEYEYVNDLQENKPPARSADAVTSVHRGRCSA
jgi:hypothetical protein